jgi:hypothetical protein
MLLANMDKDGGPESLMWWKREIPGFARLTYEAATSSLRGCYQYHTNTLRGCYEYLKRLLLIPEIPKYQGTLGAPMRLLRIS